MNTPSGWRRRRLRFDAQMHPLKSKLGLPPETEISFVAMEAVGQLGGLDLTETRPMADVYKGYTYFADGDVCLAKITPCFENGKGALADGLTNGVAFGTTELHVLRPWPDLDAKFLFYVTMTHDFRSFGKSEMLGAGGQKRVPEAFLKNWRPCLPPIPVQLKIVQFLDRKTARIDALIEKKRALLDRLAEKRQALITHAVTKGLNPDAPMKPSGIDWLGDIPAHWELFQLCRALTRPLDNGLFKKKSEFGTGTLLVNVFDIYRTDFTIDFSSVDRVLCSETEVKRYQVSDGDLLFVRSSLKTGGIAVSAIAAQPPDRAVFESHLIRARCDSTCIEPDFLNLLLASAPYRYRLIALSKVTTMTTIEQNALKSLYVVGPSIAEQSDIVGRIKKENSDIDAFCSKVKLSIERLTEYRGALITAAVTGCIDENRLITSACT